MLRVKREAVAMNKTIKILCFLLLACLSMFLMVGCAASSATAPSSDNSSSNSSSPADKVEVIYFHRTQRCHTCTYAEAEIRYTVDTYFKDELASGKVTLQVLNVEDKENADIVKKYAASYLTLAINTVKGGTDHIRKVTGIWTVVDNDKAFTEIVKSEIEKSLKGEV